MTDRTPVTLESVNAFLAAAAWMQYCRKPLNRFAYRAVQRLAEKLAEEQVGGRAKSWAEREEGRK